MLTIQIFRHLNSVSFSNMSSSLMKIRFFGWKCFFKNIIWLFYAKKLSKISSIYYLLTDHIFVFFYFFQMFICSLYTFFVFRKLLFFLLLFLFVFLLFYYFSVWWKCISRPVYLRFLYFFLLWNYYIFWTNWRFCRSTLTIQIILEFGERCHHLNSSFRLKVMNKKFLIFWLLTIELP